MCKFDRQFDLHSPKNGFHHVGPWHRVGATMENTLDIKWIVLAIRGELNPLSTT